LAISNAGGLGRNSLFRAAEKIIYLSPRARGIFETYGAPPTKSAVIPNFTERRESIGSHTERWVYAGRLTKEKGIAKLIDMWPHSTPLDVYGSGPEEMIVAQLASKKDVTLHGLVSSSTANRAVSRAAGVVLPSLWAEGIPTIYLESLAAGVPVLAHRGNSAADDIEKHGHGCVYSDEDSLLRGVQDILSHRIQYSELSMKLHDRQYSKTAWLKNVSEIYRTAIRGNEK
jgi:glycosyltransferase involved in cell wall biosynthesis